MGSSHGLGGVMFQFTNIFTISDDATYATSSVIDVWKEKSLA